MSPGAPRPPWYDGWLHPLAALVGGLTETGDEPGVRVTRLAVDLPVELVIEPAGDGVLIAGAPPTQHVSTTVMPVLHRLRLTIAASDETGDEGGDEGGD